MKIDKGISSSFILILLKWVLHGQQLSNYSQGWPTIMHKSDVTFLGLFSNVEDAF